MKLEEGPDTDVDAKSKTVNSPDLRERVSMDYESSIFEGQED